MDYIISKDEETLYNTTGEMSPRLEGFWKDFLDKLPSNLKEEALSKGFKLLPHEFEKDNTVSFYHNLKFAIPNASKELEKHTDNYHNILICMIDPV